MWGEERSITNNKLLRLICNELVINGLALSGSLTITEQFQRSARDHILF